MNVIGDVMDLKLNTIAPVFLLVAASTSLAAPRLTPEQCNDYPFKQPVGQITRAQLNQELAELEAVGYDPVGEDPSYPDDLEAAEKKLQAEYQRDCLTPNPTVSITN
jgi:hypothetical protein